MEYIDALDTALVPPLDDAKTSTLRIQLAVIKAERDALAERCDFLEQMVDRKLNMRGGLWRAIVDSVPTALAITDAHFRIILCNPGFSALFGPDEAAVRGAVFSKFMNDGELFNEAEAVGRGTRHTVWSLRRKDDTLFLGAVQCTPLYDPEQALLGFLITVRDLTEEESAGASQPAQQPALPFLNDRSPVLMFAVDADARVVSASDAWLEKLGCKREEVIGQLASNYLTRASRLYLAEALKSRLKEEALWKNVETQFVKKTGEVIDVVLCATRESQPPDRDDRIVFVLQDITEQKRAEQALMARTLEFETLTDYIPVQIFRMDRQYRYLFVNRALLEASSATPELFIGKTVDERGFPPAIAERWKQQMELVFNGGEALEFEFDYATPKGHRFFRTLIVPEKKLQGRVRTIIGIMRDVTEERRASEQLKQSEANLKLAQELAQLGSYDVDLADPSSNYMSEEIYRIVGVDPEQEELTTDRFLKQLVYRPDRHLVSRAIRQAVATGSYFQLEYRIVRLDGSIRHVQSRGTVITDTLRGTRRLVGTLLDITERVEAEKTTLNIKEKLLYQQEHARALAEEELEKVKDELVRKTRLAAVGQVAASIAHELRNPLGAIRNAAFMMERRSNTLDRRLVEYLEIIQRASSIGGQIISDLLNMTRNKPPSKKHLDLCHEVQTARDRFAEYPRIRFVDAIGRQPYPLLADPGQLQQVLQNLFTNAVEAMDGEGTIVISAEQADGMDRIVICDEGPGISDEMKSLIFEPLFTTKASGTGLGLSICKQIIEQHGGQIIVDTDGRCGSRFIVCLPCLAIQPSHSFTEFESSHA
ncbi:MAG: PAS domain S-box protein [Rhodothermales bacterium]